MFRLNVGHWNLLRLITHPLEGPSPIARLAWRGLDIQWAGSAVWAVTHLEREYSRRFVVRVSMSVESRRATRRRQASCLKNRVLVIPHVFSIIAAIRPPRRCGQNTLIL